jgi:ankyrin repeat protein
MCSRCSNPARFFSRERNLNDALVSAVKNGHVDVVDYLLRHAMFDPSADDNYAIATGR